MHHPTNDPVRSMERKLERFKDDPEVRAMLELEHVGPYRILDFLGEGGMGIVYLAEQRAPFRRQVALKLVKLGMDTAEVLARFESERQALALLHHPNIASVYDAGISEGGRSYFALEYVPGPSITEFCDERRLDLDTRIALFLAVCDGVQHAHVMGIVHRDLKPSNILTHTGLDRPTPKIIDFGVAKATSHRLTDRTLHTGLGRWIGTPGYISPEQLGGNGQAVDPRTDVYSLGAVLYELLVGVPPIVTNDLAENDFATLHARLTQHEVLRPSQRVTGLAPDTRQAFATNRSTTPRGHVKTLRSEMNWILVKALEPAPERRYTSVAELREDLRRYLNHEPVQAGPPSLTYQVRKFAQRNRAAFTTMSAVFLTLIVGVIGLVIALSQKFEIQRTQLLLQERADRDLCRDLRDESRMLWPLHARRLPEMEAWLVRAEALGLRLVEYTKQFDALASNARETPPRVWPSVESRNSFEHHERLIADCRSQLQKDLSGDEVRYYQKRIEDLLKAQGHLVEAHAGFSAQRFGSSEDEQRHRTLFDLKWWESIFNGNGEHPGAIANMRWRIEYIRTHWNESQQRHDWKELQERLQDHPNYQHLGSPSSWLPFQPGLIPLGDNGEDGKPGYEEFWYLPAGGERPQPRTSTRGKGRWEVTPEMGVVLVLLPGGSFTPGEFLDENGVPRDGAPTVHLAPYFFSKYEMMQAQWTRFTLPWGDGSMMQRNPSNFRNGSDDAIKYGPEIEDWSIHPLENVPWSNGGVIAYMDLFYPTDMQWEFAARAGSVALKPVLRTPDGISLANLRDDPAMPNPRESPGNWTDGFDVTCPVDAFPPNGFGIHGMAGNVAEWCRDSYFPLDEGHFADGDGFHDGDSGTSLARGADFTTDPRDASWTLRANKTGAGANVGVRPCLPIHRLDTR